jgi:cytochrome P450
VLRRTVQEFFAYLGEIAEERRRVPADDLLSALVLAEEEGERLSEQELHGTVALLLAAGNETTTNLIGNGLLTLLKHPEQLELLRGTPELMESAVEELLRYDSAVQTDGRTALEDIEWDGHHIRKGQQVILLLGAGNHDPSEFALPNQLDITRGSKRHLSFGRGIHHCLGAPLARMEGQIAFDRLLARYETLRLAGNTAYKDHIVLRGLKSLPVDVTPVSARATVAG